MASPANTNQELGPPFDIRYFFNPSTNPNSQNSTTNLSPPFPPSTSYPPPTGPFSYQPQSNMPAFSQQDHHLADLQHQRSVSYPTPPLHPTPSPNAGARLMALLSAPPSTLDVPLQSTMPMGPIQPSSIPPAVPIFLPVPLVPNGGQAPLRMLSSRIPNGRHLFGDHVVYDVDVRLEGEVQPQLESTPITKYSSDPSLVLGRQIAVNKTYICYGLKIGAIRVLNMNTALRSLFKGLSQRVTDMAFFDEDVHLLAGASVDGRVYVWNIIEGPDDEDNPHITGKILTALQIVGEWESVHPRVCWHCHKQEFLVVAIGKHILRIDTTKVGKDIVYSEEEPLSCRIDNLIDGVQYVGKHEGEVTDVSMCQWMTTRLVSASIDGTVKIWDDRKSQPLAVMRPHDGQPVNSATFLVAPHRPDHIILITAGPMNREVKLWASAGEDGWLLPGDNESWHCTQTFELKSSIKSKVEDAFFNHVAALSQAGLFLLANAKKNVIYAIHLEYGPNPAVTRMDYIAEFTVTMPILSFTGTSAIFPNGEHIVQVYCVQTQAIQQYALDLFLCLPPLVENLVFEKPDSDFATVGASGNKPTEISFSGSAPKLSMDDSGSEIAAAIMGHPMSSASVEAVTSVEITTPRLEVRPPLPTFSNNEITSVASPPLPLSPSLSARLTDFRSPPNGPERGSMTDDHSGDPQVNGCSVDRQIYRIHSNLSDVPSLEDDSRNDQNEVVRDDISTFPKHPMKFKHPTHLVTPSEILLGASSPEAARVNEKDFEVEPNIQDVVAYNAVHNVEIEFKVIGESGSRQKNEICCRGEPRNFARENKGRVFCSQASDLSMEMARECRALSSDTYILEELRQIDGANVNEEMAQPSNAEEVNYSIKDITGKNGGSNMMATIPKAVAPIKGKKQKGKSTQGASLSAPSPSAFNSSDSFFEQGLTSCNPTGAGFSQIMSMQEKLNQLSIMQKEFHKQMTATVTVAVTKEGKRLEAALGRGMEKPVKANIDASWARLQEQNVKQEKLARERTQQMASLMINWISKDLPTLLEKTTKKELAAVGPAVARVISPAIEKAMSTSITEAFQRGVSDKAVNQLEKAVNSKLEAIVARHMQAQFQTSGKQALQDALRSSLEASVIPGFEMSCKAMFEQVDATFQKGLVEHTTAAQLQFESMHSLVGLALRDSINSASTMSQTLIGELADGQRKLLALAVAGTNSEAVHPLHTQLSIGPLGGLHDKIEAPLDPIKELSRLIAEQKYEEAFTIALQRRDVSMLYWLCSQIDLQRILSVFPLPLSQGVLLSLLQQLACDIRKDTLRKLAWMTDVVNAINPADPTIALHVRSFFEQVYQILDHHRSLPTNSSAELSSVRLVMHVVNSMLMTC